jgi:hypothetical protein
LGVWMSCLALGTIGMPFRVAGVSGTGRRGHTSGHDMARHGMTGRDRRSGFLLISVFLFPVIFLWHSGSGSYHEHDTWI